MAEGEREEVPEVKEPGSDEKDKVNPIKKVRILPHPTLFTRMNLSLYVHLFACSSLSSSLPPSQSEQELMSRYPQGLQPRQKSVAQRKISSGVSSLPPSLPNTF